MTTTVLRCDYCRRRFSDKRGCEYVDGDERPPVYGSECHPLSLGEKCYDCGCPRKTLHHATCPRLRVPALSSSRPFRLDLRRGRRVDDRIGRMIREFVTVQSGSYAVRPASVAHSRHSWAADRLAAWCARDLHIRLPRIAWYIDPEGQSPSAERSPLRGYVHDDEPHLIFVFADQSELQTLRSVAHESYHQYEYASGWTPSEDRAEVYARRVASAYQRRDIP